MNHVFSRGYQISACVHLSFNRLKCVFTKLIKFDSALGSTNLTQIKTNALRYGYGGLLGSRF